MRHTYKSARLYVTLPVISPRDACNLDYFGLCKFIGIERLKSPHYFNTNELEPNNLIHFKLKTINKFNTLNIR